MSKMFLIFYYILNGQEYVEAYPVHDISIPYESLLPNDCPHAFMVCNSRNQARKEAYKLWVDSSGHGFNKMPHPRSYALQ